MTAKPSDIPGYLVWNPESGFPTARHTYLEDAQTEAHRLSRANPGRRFHVMVSSGFYEEPEQPSTWHPINPLDHEIPF